MRNIVAQACGLVLLTVSPLVGQLGKFTGGSNHPAIGDPVAIAAGAKLWARSCAGCHGPDGTGGRGPNLVRRPVWHPLGDDRLFNVIRDGLPGTDMPSTRLSDKDTWQLVAFLHALISPAAENPAPGDEHAGAEIFWGEKAACSTCHNIHGRGARIGPDLTNIGRLRPLGLIKESVLNPSREWQNSGRLNSASRLGQEDVTLRLIDGSIIQGIARNRNNYSLQVVDRSGKLYLLSMRDVEEIAIRDRSLMPQNYGRLLSAEELKNLFSFLARQSARPLVEKYR